jgi:hypothetical protein
VRAQLPLDGAFVSLRVWDHSNMEVFNGYWRHEKSRQRKRRNLVLYLYYREY